MPRSDNLYDLPKDLPEPFDDGACDHLVGKTLPRIALRSTAGRWVTLADLPGTVVVYCYPRTGRPDRDPPAGWNSIPGARGCTPQTCAFRDYHQEIRQLGAVVFGLSTQDTEYQQEMVQRLGVPFEVLSDADLRFALALRLPTFSEHDMVLIKRLTLIVAEGLIEQIFYPVFPPDENAVEVIRWLRLPPNVSRGDVGG